MIGTTVHIHDHHVETLQDDLELTRICYMFRIEQI